MGDQQTLMDHRVQMPVTVTTTMGLKLSLTQPPSATVPPTTDSILNQPRGFAHGKPAFAQLGA